MGGRQPRRRAPIANMAAGKPKGKRPPAVVKQVQVSGDGSVSIQSGGDITNVTISASNGSVAAWSIGNVNRYLDMINALTLVPGSGPTPQPVQPQRAPAVYPYRAQMRVLVGAALLVVLHTALLLISLHTLAEPDNATWMTYAGLLLNPAGIAINGYRIRLGRRERRKVQAAHLRDHNARAEKAEAGKPKLQPIWTWDTVTAPTPSAARSPPTTSEHPDPMTPPSPTAS